MPEAITSQRMMPPKMLTRMALTCSPANEAIRSACGVSVHQAEAPLPEMLTGAGLTCSSASTSLAGDTQQQHAGGAAALPAHAAAVQGSLRAAQPRQGAQRSSRGMGWPSNQQEYPT